MSLNTKQTWAEKLKNFINKLKEPVTYILCAYISFVQFFPVDVVQEVVGGYLLWPAVLGISITLCKLLFDIHKKIHEPENLLPFYETWSDVVDSGELLKLFEKRLQDDNVLNISIVGISSRFHWNYIRNLIVSKFGDENVTFNITFVMLDTSAYDKLNFVDDNFRKKYYLQAKATKNDLILLKDDYENGNGNTVCKCNIELLEYQFMPSFYGILLDNKFLYLGHTSWNNEKLQIEGAGQAYNLFMEDDDFSGSEKIRVFNSWISYIREHQNK